MFGNAAVPFVRFTPQVSLGDKTPALFPRQLPQVVQLGKKYVAGRKLWGFSDTVVMKRLRDLRQDIFRRMGLLDRLDLD